MLLAFKFIKKKMQIEGGLDLEQNKNWKKIKNNSIQLKYFILIVIIKCSTTG